MFLLLQPIWMLAATGILIPLLIHLWNIRKGKILKVGSIAFLTQSSKNFAASLKLTELLLLVLRCLIIILLALLLAKPRWNQSFPKAKLKGWVLLEKENISGAYHHFKPLIDSLTKAGYEFHYFNDSFSKADLADVLTDRKEPIYSKRLSYRVLLKQLDRMVPAGLPVYLFTTNYLNRFTGRREAVSLNLHWLTYTPSDSTAAFVAKAYRISEDSIRVLMGHTQPGGTIYTHEDIEMNKNANPGIIFTKKDNGLFISYKKDEQVMVDTTPLNITIFTNKYFTDAAYIKAAAEAVQQFSKHRTRLSMPTKIEDLPPVQDWLFWLSELPVPASLKAGNIFRYQQGEEKNTNSWINTTTAINGQEERIALYKIIDAKRAADSIKPVWQDGFGNTLLGLQENKINTWRFFSRLDPSWNDLPWSDQFPQLIFTLLYPTEKTGLSDFPDKRIISDRQIQPAHSADHLDPDKKKFIPKDISQIFWLGAFVLFCLERFVATKSKKEVVHG